ncbi:AAA family ATPase [Bacteroidota bacterium]
MNESPIKIVVTGPESTGKTELAMYLSRIFGAEYIPEYARTYVENLHHSYTYQDIEHIARVQEKQFFEACKSGNKIIFFDTYLIITKVWFQEVFDKVPLWIDRKLKESEISLFLLCDFDLEWVEDPVRENPGQRRRYLFERYRNEIEMLGIPWELVTRIGPIRSENAKTVILQHFPQLENQLK